jgi:DNA (cytosine-5)-methyltransferase 1
VAILDAADYGAPQQRKRLFIIGCSKEHVNTPYSFPKVTHSRDRLLHDQFVSGDYWHKHGVSRPRYFETWALKRYRNRIQFLENLDKPHTLPWQTLRPIIAANKQLNDPWSCIRQGARLYRKHTGTPQDWPSKTIKAGVHGVPGGENIVRLSEKRFRYLSLRECASCQGFPKEYIANCSFTQSMKLIGNAVPVQLSLTVISSLIRHLSLEGTADD